MWCWVLMVLLMGSLLALEGVSSTCCVSHNASVYILDTLSYGSMACHYGEDVERSSKSHLQTLLLLVLQLLPHCHPFFSIVKVGPVNIHQFACPRNAYIIFLYNVIGQFFLYLGL